MLRIIESTSASQAKSYFSTADYYREGQELQGQWRGEGARRLGLLGTIETAAWDALCDNRDPTTGEPLTLRTKVDRRVGYDFNFHVPKSFSVLQALTADERLSDLARDAVRETMAEIEQEMATRVRKDVRNEDRTTGNMVWGEFVHLTARPVDGVPDPHWHVHCYAFNVTHDAVENAWKAGQFGNLKRDATYFEGRFHARLGSKLADLGVPVERTKTGWEIADVPRSVIDKFSRRTTEIEAEARRKGIVDPAVKAELGAKTRSRKAKDLTLDQLRAEWESRLTDEEREAMSRVAARLGGERLREETTAGHDAVALAATHCFERQSVVPERKLQAEAYKRSVGRCTLGTVDEAFAQAPLIIKDRHGRRMATTEAVLAEERKMLAFARQGRGTQRPWVPGEHRFERDWLNDEQKAAVRHLLHSRDRVLLVRGVAGTGKTSMMQEAVEAIERSGTKVHAFAPSAKASRGVLRDKGFHNADTVARLLADTELQRSLQGQAIWIDEAGMVGSRTLGRVFQIAERQEARVILTGDRRQHGSVERGAALRLLETEAGCVPAEIKQIMRQSAQYRQAVAQLSEGHVRDAFAKLNQLGWIREAPDGERYRLLAADYVRTVEAGESALVISPTHLEAERVTNAIRDRLRTNGTLSTHERTLTVLRNANLTEGERADPAQYTPGDVLVFHQNAKGFKKGERVTVTTDRPPVEQAARFMLFHPALLKVAEGDVLRVTKNGKSLEGHRLNNGDLLHVEAFDEAGRIVTREGKTLAADFGHLDYGYCVTSHQSQGCDVDRVFIGQSSASFAASSREQFYVSVSRGRKQATIYTDHKAALLGAVEQTDERLSATELVQGGRMPEPLEPDRSPVVKREAPAADRQRKEDLVYER